jgi:peptide/nickel transport system ATP-binding protein
VSLLEVDDLRVSRGDTTITHGVSLHVEPGETVGVVGESGSGKSVTAKAIVGLLPPTLTASGSVRFKDEELVGTSQRALGRVRGSGITMMFQDPFTMLNPLMRCGDHIAESIDGGSRSARKDEVARRLDEVGIDAAQVAGRYPFQLSGGMQQRVGLAAALGGDPELLIADEPTTALDVTTQAEILDLLGRLQSERGMGVVLITHDLRVAFGVCDRIYVLYAGTLLEEGDAAAMEREPLHPYTLGLILSEPSAERRQSSLVAIEGAVPAADDVAGQCPFAPRCRWAADECLKGDPPLREVEPGRLSACVRIDEIREEMAALRRSAVDASSVAHAPAGDPQAFIVVDGVAKTFGDVEALRGVSMTLQRKESVGLVGESGSGKTTLGRCLVGLETPSAGSITIDGIDATDYQRVRPAERARLRETIQVVFQDPYSSLNPRLRIGRTLGEALSLHGSDLAVADLLDLVGLPPEYAARRPSALSGGERQRVAIARSLAVRPAFLVCDEPVSALDVSVQAQIINLLKRLRDELGLGYLFITHDLAVVRQVVDRAYVLYRGEVVEEGPIDALFEDPQHDYTRRLLASMP